MSTHPSDSRKKELRNRWLTIAGLIIVAAVYVAALIVFRRSRLASGAVSLQAMIALNITLILVMLFVLGRNVIKIFVERRRQKPGSQFSTRVVVTYIGMVLIPAVMLFIVASGLIRTAVDTWFSTDTEQIVQRAREVSERAQEDQGRELQRFALGIADEISEDRIGTLEDVAWDFLRDTLLIPRSRQYALDAMVVYYGPDLLLDPYFDPDGEFATYFQRPAIPGAQQSGQDEEGTAGERRIEPLPETHALHVSAAHIAAALQGQPFRRNVNQVER